MADSKRGWKRVKFGEVVRQVKDRADPSTAGLDRYVAGEHMDTDDLRIRRWGNIGDGYLGPAFHMRFKPGHVLYGSRRTYLRKVAVADFEGICANTTFVLASANPDELLPELLPFIMQTEGFHEHSRRESKGSVNPYVNFSDLAWFELALPPLDEQRRMVKLLSANLGLHHALSIVGERAVGMRASLARRYFLPEDSSRHFWGHELIAGGALSLQTGPFGTVLKASAYTTTEQGYPVINPVDMADGRIVVDHAPRVGAEDWQRLSKYWMREGDMLLGRKRHMDNLVFVQSEHAGYVVGSDCIRFRADPSQIHARYLFHLLRSEPVQHWLQAQAGGNGTVMPGMNEQILGRLRIYLPELETQERIAREFDELEGASVENVRRLGECQTMFKEMVGALLGGSSS